MNDDDVLEQKVGFGKYKDSGATWRQVVERDAEYARWVVDNAATVGDDLREAISEALDEQEWAF